MRSDTDQVISPSLKPPFSSPTLDLCPSALPHPLRSDERPFTLSVPIRPLTSLAMRTRCDVRGVGERLRVEHGVPTVLYLSVDELSAATVEERTHELRLGPHAISAV